jgi:UDP-galactopyranose mutase
MNQSVLVLEKRNHIGGNCYDYVDGETGLRVNLYGAHIFHTNHKRVWEYVQWFSEWTPYEHKVLAAIDGKHVPVPVNIDTVNSLLGTDIQNSEQMNEWLRREQIPSASPKNSEEMALSRVGQRLYQMLFKPYTIKQWSKTPDQLGPEVLARIPVRNNRDARYFSDKYQALPRHGYTNMIRNMLAHRLITVMTNVDYFHVRNSIECGRTYFTGPIDAYFAHLGWEKLEYRSLDFERKVIRNVDHFQPGAVVNHPSSHVGYTRIVEYKHFLNQSSPHTVVFYEYSKDGGDPYYPVPDPKNKALYAKYQAMAAKERGVTFVGRLANYKYFNMDESILNALELFDRDNNRNYTPNTQRNNNRNYTPNTQAMPKLKTQFVPRWFDKHYNGTYIPDTLRMCVVTAVMGDYERRLKEPAKQTMPGKFFAFTDRSDLRSGGSWTVLDYHNITSYHFEQNCAKWKDLVNSPCNNKNRFNLAKFVKTQFNKIPHIVDNCDVGIWIDGTVRIHSSSFFESLAGKVNKGKSVIVFEHEYRSGSMEAEEVASVRVGRYQTTFAYGMPQPYQDLNKQKMDWKKEGWQEFWWRTDPEFKHLQLSPAFKKKHFGMWVTCMVAFDLRRPENHAFLDRWWLENLKHTTQDQMTFAYTVWKERLLPWTLPDEETRGRHGANDYYKKMAHGQ